MILSPKLRDNRLFSLLCLIFCLCFTPLSKGQTATPVELPTKADYVAVDAQGNIYVIENTLLSKYSIEGSLLATFNRFILGNISSIDVSNPLKIMLFYKESGNLLFLDDKLTPLTEPLSLFAKNLYHIILASYSTNNYIWLYNAFQQELITLDFYLNIVQKSKIARSLETPFALAEIKEKMMVLQDSSSLFLFDQFGTYIKQLPLRSSAPIQIIGNNYYYLNNNGIYSYYDEQKLELSTLDFQAKNSKQIIKYREQYIILTQKGTVVIGNVKF
jgi:hypothetical protein